MTTSKDLELIQQLKEATEQGRLGWHPTATVDEFTTSFRGRFSVVVSKVPDDYYIFQMCDDSGREMLKISPGNAPPEEVGVVRDLFDAARRQALHVDKAIEDILQELKAS
ncbi:MAG: hypothetical protein ACLQOO_27565 [Terriglobia bacterium]